MTTTRLVVAVVSVFLLIPAAGCRTYRQLPYPGDEAAGSAYIPGPYRIRSGDKLRIHVPLSSEFKTDEESLAIVRPDGRITVRYIGEVQAGGRTVEEVSAEVAEGLGKHLQQAGSSVQVDVVEQGPNYVYVGGEVGSPGAISFTDPRIDLVEAIIKAGGYKKDTADLHTVIIAREDENGCRSAWKVNLCRLLTSSCPPQPIRLKDRDVVLIPNTPVDQANVWVDQYINKMIPGGPAFIATLFLFAGV